MSEELDSIPNSILALNDQALLKLCRIDVYRASGPGGQKRNKTCSAVRLRVGSLSLMVIAEESRSQHVNKKRAIRRLREAIALTVRKTIDVDHYQRSEVMLTCMTGNGRFQVSLKNAHYPVVVREVLDLLVGCGLRVSDTARKLETSTGELVKFMKRDPKLWKQVNQLRSARKLKPLR